MTLLLLFRREEVARTSRLARRIAVRSASSCFDLWWLSDDLSRSSSSPKLWGGFNCSGGSGPAATDRKRTVGEATRGRAVPFIPRARRCAKTVAASDAPHIWNGLNRALATAVRSVALTPKDTLKRRTVSAVASAMRVRRAPARRRWSDSSEEQSCSLRIIRRPSQSRRRLVRPCTPSGHSSRRPCPCSASVFSFYVHCQSHVVPVCGEPRKNNKKKRRFVEDIDRLRRAPPR